MPWVIFPLAFKGKESIKLSSATLPTGEAGADSLASAARSTRVQPRMNTLWCPCARDALEAEINYSDCYQEMIWLGRLAVKAATVHYRALYMCNISLTTGTLRLGERNKLCCRNRAWSTLEFVHHSPGSSPYVLNHFAILPLLQMVVVYSLHVAYVMVAPGFSVATYYTSSPMAYLIPSSLLPYKG